ncbi:hypothetical protein ACFCXR_15255 [Streptomyces noursei]|uniref:hypothetical protein n=1 Tax=Streptomyces noursei TaxID=1971 RepID=UPI00045EF294|nr:hypothetical protein [Streptomyces noursei]AIA03429.1 hypothetical protein DC74_2929 [Streptomyces noursei]
MTLAALPTHDRTTDPLWLGLFNAYSDVITPLRWFGWTTDVEVDKDAVLIRADLGDGNELIIASEGNRLPANAADATGWLAVKQNIAEPAKHTVLYDSTPNGPQRHHGIQLLPLFVRLEALDAARRAPRVEVTASHVSFFGACHNTTAGIWAAGAGVARFMDWVNHIQATEGYAKVWERPEGSGGYPEAIFERSSNVAVLRVRRASDG